MKTGDTAKTILVLIAAMLALPAFAAEQGTLYPEGSIDKQALEETLPDKPPYSPYADLSFPARPLFGDTHVHTSYSLDAGAAGARLGPADWPVPTPLRG
jgi:hypothetical protein